MTNRAVTAAQNTSSGHNEIAIFELMIRALPNSLTLGNLFVGSCAIAAFFEGMPRVTLVLAILCLILDLVDGFLARRLNASSALGVQLDSLADLVSFGVLPGAILFVFLRNTCAGSLSFAWLQYAAFLVAVGVALRLARFNIDTRDRSVFFGLPTPSAATLIFGLLWMQFDGHPWWPFVCTPVVLYALILLLPFLMLSNLRLWSTKGIGLTHGKWILGGYLLIFALLLIFTGSAAVTLMVVGYILFGIVNMYLKLY